MKMVCHKAVQPTCRKSRSSQGEANKDDVEADNLWTGLEVIKSMLLGVHMVALKSRTRRLSLMWCMSRSQWKDLKKRMTE